MQKQAFTLDPLERPVNVARQSLYRISVELRIRDVPESFNEPVSESSYLAHVFFHVVTAFFERDCHGGNARHIDSSGTLSSLLGSAFDDIHKFYAVARV